MSVFIDGPNSGITAEGVVTAGQFVGSFRERPSLVDGTPTTALGPPSSGTFEVGDIWLDARLGKFRCTVAGTPGTWIQTIPNIYRAIISQDGGTNAPTVDAVIVNTLGVTPVWGYAGIGQYGLTAVGGFGASNVKQFSMCQALIDIGSVPTIAEIIWVSADVAQLQTFDIATGNSKELDRLLTPVEILVYR